MESKERDSYLGQEVGDWMEKEKNQGPRWQSSYDMSDRESRQRYWEFRTSSPHGEWMKGSHAFGSFAFCAGMVTAEIQQVKPRQVIKINSQPVERCLIAVMGYNNGTLIISHIKKHVCVCCLVSATWQTTFLLCHFKDTGEHLCASDLLVTVWLLRFLVRLISMMGRECEISHSYIRKAKDSLKVPSRISFVSHWPVDQ